MIDQILAFAIVSLAVIVIPGPDLLLLFKNAIKGGRRGASSTAIGIMVGNAILATAAAVGLTAILLASEALYSAIQFAGGLYLLYIGVKSLLAFFKARRLVNVRKAPLSSKVEGKETSMRDLIGFRQGLFSNILNPKVAAFYLSLFPQFDLAPLNPEVQQFVLAASFWIMALVWYIVVIIFLSRFEQVFRSTNFQLGADLVAGTLLSGLGAYILAGQTKE